MTLKLAVIGRTGQLAKSMRRQADKQGYIAVFYDRKDCDLSGPPSTIRNFIMAIDKPDVLIIAAAYTAVDHAESDAETAYSVNYIAPTCIAQACKARNIPLIHISTDYVFDGKSHTPYRIDAPTCPINVYGASKLAGEQGIFSTNCRATVLRTSWVFDGISHNFFTTMLLIAQNKTRIDVVADQIGRPTYVGHLANAALITAKQLHQNNPASEGIFHVSGSGNSISWSEFARAIFSLAKNKLPHDVQVVDITSQERPTPAARPAFSVLDITSFEQNFNCALPHWTEGLKIAYADWANTNAKAVHD